MKTSQKKIIGVLGGLGPDTTSEFYLDLIHATSQIQRPAVAIWSLPLNIRKESEYISHGRHTRYFLDELINGMQRLRNAGADFVVIPCNTVHEFHPQLSNVSTLPIPHLIQLVAKEVQARGWEKVLLLATSRTIATKLYQTELHKFGIEVEVPTVASQARLDKLIQGLLRDCTASEHQDFVARLIRESGAANVLLGCTDLQLVFQPSETVIDSMRVLVDHTAHLARTV